MSQSKAFRDLFQSYFARYYEGKELTDKAASLYYKGSNYGKAIALCLSTQQWHMLDIITADMKAEVVDPEVLAKCGAFFMERGEFGKAMGMLVKGKQLERAVALCLEKNVFISEEMAEQMAPEEDPSQTPESRTRLLLKIADVCFQQGSYHVACKKYTQVRESVAKGETEVI